MKDTLQRVRLAVGLLAVAAVGAQAQDTDRAIVNVPFDFVAGNITLPPGNYTVERVFSQHASALLLRGTNGNAVMLTTSVDTDSMGKVSLIFNRYGSKSFLRAVRTDFGTHWLAPTSTEKNAAALARVATAGASGSH